MNDYIYILNNYDPKNILQNFMKSKIDGVQVKKINDILHPVFGKYGLFATKKWYPYEILGEYRGEIKNYFSNSQYQLSFDKISMSLIIDAKTYGNECRYINDYHNISKFPNCQFQFCYIESKPKMLIIVTKEIDINQEILIDYQYEI